MQSVVPAESPSDSNVGLAYAEARAGRRHAGWYRLQRMFGDRQIRRGIRSIEKQIEAHLTWIEKPALKVENWTERSVPYRQAVLSRWRDDISRQREQIDILQGILRERAHGTE